MRAVEQRRGHSLCGPHRDDLVWTRNGRPLPSEASSGEIHRTVALAKLAEWQTVCRARGEEPLFAADDFDAGLSRASVEAFLSCLPERAQVILTTASDPARWKAERGAALDAGGPGDLPGAGAFGIGSLSRP